MTGRKPLMRNDIFFKLCLESPIPFRERFRGLNYYPPNTKYRFEIELHEHKKKERIRIIYTRGEEKEFIRWGEFRLKIDDKEVTL